MNSYKYLMFTVSGIVCVKKMFARNTGTMAH